jgi:hypothetical protein
LRGNLAPRGAVLKPSAATPELMQHRGRAVVFENFDMYKARINDPELDVDANSILVMKNCGPKGYPGMAEVGNMGLPAKLLAQGVTDMVRISDARMSGTAYGTVVCTWRRKRLRRPLAAVRKATGSNSIAPAAACTWTFRTPNWRRAWRICSRRSNCWSAVIASCTSTMSCRRIRVATSTSWSVAVGLKCRVTPTNPAILERACSRWKAPRAFRQHA